VGGGQRKFGRCVSDEGHEGGAWYVSIVTVANLGLVSTIRVGNRVLGDGRGRASREIFTV